MAGFLLAQAIIAPGNNDVRRFRMDVIGGLNTPMRGAPAPRDKCQQCGRPAYRCEYNKRWLTEQR